MVKNISLHLDEVQRQLRQRFPAATTADIRQEWTQRLEHPVLASGMAELDALLPGGGLPRACLTEISGGPSSGKTSLAFALIAAAQRQEEDVAYIDCARTFHSPAAVDAGLNLKRLLVVRPPAASPDAGFRAIDHLLRSRGFPLIVLDLGGLREVRARQAKDNPLERLFRIARLAKVHEVLVLLLTETPADKDSLGSPIALRLAVSRCGFRFSPRAQPPFVLGGVDLKVLIRKNKFGPPGAEVTLPFALAMRSCSDDA